MKKYAIFGAGKRGKKAYEDLKEKYIVCFIDNDITKCEKTYMTKPVISFDVFVRLYHGIKIIIAIDDFESVINQIKDHGIEFEVWMPRKNFYGISDELIYNKYETNDEHDEMRQINTINRYTKGLYRCVPIFNHIEIETYNRCNGACQFCPVNVNSDTRIEKTMTDALFEKIINELNEMDYRGCIALFSNNEPFLDKRMVRLCRYVKEKLPYAKQHLYTNGSLLSVTLFEDVIDSLDELIINNYNQELKLNPTVEKIKDYCEENMELRNKVTIALRKPIEVLESRGGNAPNKEKNDNYSGVGCTHPFRQIIVRPDGKVSLCCNDALGMMTMGDLNTQRIIDVWYGKEFEKIRSKLVSEGRGGLDFCRWCDSLRLV